MNGITHTQAQRYLRRAADELLTDGERTMLAAHLRDCASCRAEAEALQALGAHLADAFHARWDGHNGPSQNVLVNIQSQTRRIIMSNRINAGLKTLAGIAVLVVLGLVLNSVFGQLRKTVPNAQPTPYPSPAGLIAFFTDRDGNQEIYTMRADGSNQTNLTNSPTNEYMPTWSPDGTRLAFISDRLGRGEIFIMNADGSNVVQLTNVPDTETWSDLDWSPDGKYLVAQHIPIEAKRTYPDRGHLNIYLIHTDGSGVAQLTENENWVDYSPQWSPKGDLIAFIRPWGIYAIRPDGTGLTDLTKSGARGDTTFDWSPDGSQIMYFSSPNHCFPDDCPPNEIRYVLTDGTYPITLLTLTDPLLLSVERIRWSPDGTRLFIVTLDFDGMAYFYIMNSDGSGLTRLGNFAPINNLPGHIPQVDWSPDGLFVVYDSDRAGNKGIYILDVNETLRDPDIQPARLTNTSSADYSPVWQPQP